MVERPDCRAYSRATSWAVAPPGTIRSRTPWGPCTLSTMVAAFASTGWDSATRPPSRSPRDPCARDLRLGLQSSPCHLDPPIITATGNAEGDEWERHCEWTATGPAGDARRPDRPAAAAPAPGGRGRVRRPDERHPDARQPRLDRDGGDPGRHRREPRPQLHRRRHVPLRHARLHRRADRPAAEAARPAGHRLAHRVPPLPHQHPQDRPRRGRPSSAVR